MDMITAQDPSVGEGERERQRERMEGGNCNGFPQICDAPQTTPMEKKKQGLKTSRARMRAKYHMREIRDRSTERALLS